MSGMRSFPRAATSKPMKRASFERCGTMSALTKPAMTLRGRSDILPACTGFSRRNELSVQAFELGGVRWAVLTPQRSSAIARLMAIKVLDLAYPCAVGDYADLDRLG